MECYYTVLSRFKAISATQHKVTKCIPKQAMQVLRKFRHKEMAKIKE